MRRKVQMTLEDVARHAAEGHSAFSPSSSKMWLTCSGSLIPNLLSDDEGSKEAAEGTVAHEVAEIWLKTGKRPTHMVGSIQVVDGHPIEIDDEMLSFVSDYIDYVRELENDAEEFLTETRVDFSDLTPIPDQGGTSDHIAIVALSKKKKRFEIVVTDLKYGKGVRVVAQDNTQARIYGYGAWKIFKDRYNIVRVRIRIAHPRLADGYTEETISVSELLEFAEYVRERAAAAWQWDAPRTPSEEGCRWCKVRGSCAAAYKFLSEVTSDAFDDDDEDLEYDIESLKAINDELEDTLEGVPFQYTNPGRLSTPALGRILAYRSLNDQFFKAVEEELLDRAISGEQSVPGWKLVESRTIRKWQADLGAIYKKLKSFGLKDGHIFGQTVLSPAQAEKLLKAKAGLSGPQAAKIIESLAVKPPGAKTLARTTDNREELPSVGSVFDDDDEHLKT